MYVDYSTWEVYEYKISSLNLDLNNPRIKYRGVPLNQTQILKFLISNEKVYDLAKKISEEGYFVGEEPIICIEKGKKVVLEGNRRTAALKLLQEPKRFVSAAKAKILLKNIAQNNFPFDKKLKCYIAPNRLLANPIIYSRHNGTSLERWKTGNQYSFVAEMYYKDALSINDICDVLNESKTKIIKPLKAYNLFLEGQDILLKEDNINIEISDFDFTNLERFYGYEDGKKLMGIEFDEENGELSIQLPRDEFEKRLRVIFKRLIDSERFSRDFNKEDQKWKYIEELKKDSNIDLSIQNISQNIKSKSSEEKANLNEQKSAIVTRTKKRQIASIFGNCIIQSDADLNFDDDKLYELFLELKTLSIDKKYSFAILLRTFLEQVLFYYVNKKSLSEKLVERGNEEKRKNGLAKVSTLAKFIQGKYGISEEIDKEQMMSILKFDGDKSYSSSSLKIMLDYIKNHELTKYGLEPSLLKNIVQYLDNIKNELDLAVHNLHTTIDVTHNRRAWNNLYPFFKVLAKEISDTSE